MPTTSPISDGPSTKRTRQMTDGGAGRGAWGEVEDRRPQRVRHARADAQEVRGGAGHLNGLAARRREAREAIWRALSYFHNPSNLRGDAGRGRCGADLGGQGSPHGAQVRALVGEVVPTSKIT